MAGGHTERLCVEPGGSGASTPAALDHLSMQDCDRAEATACKNGESGDHRASKGGDNEPEHWGIRDGRRNIDNLARSFGSFGCGFDNHEIARLHARVRRRGWTHPKYSHPAFIADDCFAEARTAS